MSKNSDWIEIVEQPQRLGMSVSGTYNIINDYMTCDYFSERRCNKIDCSTCGIYYEFKQVKDYENKLKREKQGGKI
jgi:hypothetical protein